MSFLEKLRRGSESRQPAAVEQEKEVNEEEATEENEAAQENAATFAAHRNMVIEDEPQEKHRSKKTVRARREDPEEVQEDGDEKDPQEEWLKSEGQLTVDVYQTETELILESAVAGIKVEDLDVLIEDDVITIKGKRNNPLPDKGDYFIQECYWGKFSRKVILPVEVDAARADASMREGVLIIRIPKIQREKKKKVLIRG